jgi:two-component system phosphate regulon sensor histidine kinase PhoR
MHAHLRGLDRRRLRLGLLAFFLALALPSAILIYQAFGRLEWEGFHQQQVLAEELAVRIDARLGDLVDAESARGFAEYGFLVVEGDPRAGYLQRSPLSAFPPRPEVPGLIGYFQVDAQGAFSSPLLPRGSIDPAAYGLTQAEVSKRAAAEQRVEQILSRNRLVERRRGEGGAREAGAPKIDQTASARSSYPESLGQAGGKEALAATGIGVAPTPRGELAPPGKTAQGNAQSAFDRLNELQAPAKDRVARARQEQADLDRAGMAEEAPGAPARPPAETKGPALGPAQAQVRAQRQSRREIVVVPETEGAAGPGPDPPPKPEPGPALGAQSATKAAAMPVPSSPAPATPSRMKDAMPDAGAEAIARRPPIRTFESEIDPFEVSRLAGGQIVLYRKVWRDGQRYTQGALIDPAPFLAAFVATPFREAALARASDLSVTWQGEGLAVFPGQSGRDYGSPGQVLSGTPLYQTRLSAPLSDLGLAFSVTRLPLAPGAAVIVWVGAALAIVLCGGVLALYRLGVRQIDLIRQQQDFVSAVSHELKTPLTSIRMYGEMLLQGWVPENKRPGYYRFIYDESERLSRLINNVLQLARMTRNEQHLEPRPIACAELMDLARSKVASRVEAAGFLLRLDCPAETGASLVQADPDAFAQIVINLVDNAVKFAAKAQVREVEIGCEGLRGGAVRFRVRDYGPGIPSDQMKKVFRLFYRAEGTLTRETLGTGIGLALVQGLAQAMGGAVDLVNRNPGAEFRLILPGQRLDQALPIARPPKPC